VNAEQLDLILSCARTIERKTAGRISPPELLGAGWEGLHKATIQFKPTAGVPFGAYARTRITGSMLDFLRKFQDNALHEDDGTGLERAAPQEPEQSEELSRELFGKMSPRVKSMAYMYYVQLLNYREIAEKHGCCEARVSQLLKRFRESIGAPRAYRRNKGVI